MAEFVNTVDVIEEETLLDSLINGSITEYNDDKMTNIKLYAFYNCNKLISVNFSALTSIGAWTFQKCTSLYKADFLSCRQFFDHSQFLSCSALKVLILRANAVVTLGNSNALSGTMIASGTGYIYVPSALVDSYKVATNWSTYATQFRALEDYTVDSTITGELDETKI